LIAVQKISHPKPSIADKKVIGYDDRITRMKQRAEELFVATVETSRPYDAAGPAGGCIRDLR